MAGKRSAAYDLRTGQLHAFDDLEHDIRSAIKTDDATRAQLQESYDGTDKDARARYRTHFAINEMACRKLEHYTSKMKADEAKISDLTRDTNTQKNIASVLQTRAQDDKSSTVRTEAQELRHRLENAISRLGLSTTQPSQRYMPKKELRHNIVEYLGGSSSPEGYTHYELFDLVHGRAREFASLKEKVGSLEQEVREKDERLAQQDDQKSLEIQETQYDQNEEVARLNFELKESDKQLEDYRRRVEQHGVHLQLKEEKILKLESELKPLNEQLESLAEFEGVSAKARLEGACARLNKLVEEAKHKDNLIDSLEEQIAQYTAPGEADFESMLVHQELNMSATDLTQKLKTANDNIRFLANRVSELRQDLDRHNDTIESNNDVITNLRADISEEVVARVRMANIVTTTCKEVSCKRKLLSWKQLDEAGILQAFQISFSGLVPKTGQVKPSFVRNLAEMADSSLAQTTPVSPPLPSWLLYVANAAPVFTNQEHLDALARISQIVAKGCDELPLKLINHYLCYVFEHDTNTISRTIALSIYTDSFNRLPLDESYKMLNQAAVVGLLASGDKPSGCLLATTYISYVAALFSKDPSKVRQALSEIEWHKYMGIKLDAALLKRFQQTTIPQRLLAGFGHIMNNNKLANGKPTDVWVFRLPSSSPFGAGGIIFYREVEDPLNIIRSDLANCELRFTVDAAGEVTWCRGNQDKAKLVLQAKQSQIEGTETFVQVPGSDELYGPIEAESQTVQDYFFKVFYGDELCAACAVYTSGLTIKIPDEVAEELRAMGIWA